MSIVSQNKIIVGVDIAKDVHDVYLYPIGLAFRITNDDKGLKKLKKKLSHYDVKRVVYEASGGYEHLLAKTLEDCHELWQVNPIRVRSFIESKGIHVKTDAIDAEMIALFGAQMEPTYSRIRLSDKHELLNDLSRRRNSLVSSLVKEKNRLKHPKQVNTKESIIRHIEFLEPEIERIDDEIGKLIKDNKDWSEIKAILDSVPGVGKVTSGLLIGSMPELGKVNEKAAAAIVGVAPFIRQSGSSRGTAAIKGGRSHIRTVLYMASVVAIRYNEKLKKFYERLKKEGKCFKVAIVAVMRKLIVMLNAMVASGKKWNAA